MHVHLPESHFSFNAFSTFLNTANGMSARAAMSLGLHKIFIAMCILGSTQMLEVFTTTEILPFTN